MPLELIRIENLSKVYQLGDINVHALRGVSTTIDRGSFVAIMGPSGSGKSTFMNILGCLDRPTSGAYFLDGVSVGELDRDRLAEIRNRKIGFVFQQFNLLPRTSALANVELPLLYSPEGTTNDHKRALNALRTVGLEERAAEPCANLSHGEKRLLEIAVSLATDANLLLLDEPLAGLAEADREVVGALIQKLA